MKIPPYPPLVKGGWGDFHINVLGILTGYSELLLAEIPEGSRSRGYVDKILQSTEKGAAIIQDLLTLARRGVAVSDVINLNSVVSGFLKTPVFEKMKDYHPRVTFRTECDQNLLNIKGSPVHLEKSLMNLVSNAAEAVSGKGEVTIRTENRYIDTPVRGYDEVKEGDYAVLTISDTGMGIPAEDREKIFEPFYTKKTMGRSGTGLGLAIVWGTVKDHNGYIDLQTEIGEGTIFTLYFPVTREELTAQQQKAPIEQYMGTGESVLVVDDIADQREIATKLLTRLGYQVHAVSGGEEAVEFLKGNKADILVLDMIMDPGIDGLETYQRVLEISPSQKAIIISGFSETDRVRAAQKLGAGAYVKKPYLMEKIGVAIRDELQKVPYEQALGFMRILVVDDNDQLREMLRHILETAGHEVLEAANGKIALHLQNTLPADLVITDILMPEMEGLELIMNIRKITPCVKIIAISGGGKMHPDLCLEIASNMGADRILLKPFSKSTILSIVNELYTDSNLTDHLNKQGTSR